MRIVQPIPILILILLGAATLIVPVTPNTVPPYPDMANVISAKNYLDVWYDMNMPPAEYHVREAYSAVSGLASDYSDSITSTGDVSFSSLTSSVQDKMIGMFMSITNQSYALAKNMAKTHTLHSATESGISHHTQRLYNYNELWDKHGTVYKDAVYDDIRSEIQNTGQFVIDADSYVEAYCAYEFCVDEYNQQVEAWNNYAPSQPTNKITATSHSKAEFEKVSCFGDCNYQYDTFDMARDGHKGVCGRTLNDVPKSVCNLPVYECAFIWKCRNGRLHFAGLSPSNGSYYASAGDSHTADFSASSAFSSVYWYVKSPSQTGLGTNVETDTGGSTSTTSSMTYTFGSYDSGDYVITAYVYPYESSASVYQESYTVTVSGSSSDPPPSDPIDNTPDCSYCTDGCSSCDSDDDGDDDDDSSSGTTCSHCNEPYDPDGEYVSLHTEALTCRGCGVTFYACENSGSPATCDTWTYDENGESDYLYYHQSTD